MGSTEGLEAEETRQPSQLRAWLWAARPKTLFAAVAPVMIGTAMAFEGGQVHWLSAALCLLGAVLVQVGTNYCNDYCDFAKGADTAERTGPARAVQSGWISPRAMLAGTWFTFGAAALICLYFVHRAGVPMLWVGLFSIASGVLYTAGPRPLAYIGLGEVFVLLFFGFVAVGATFYVQALTIRPTVIAAGMGPGLLSVALLAVNNLRDIDQDRAARKLTLAARFGPVFARAEYCVAVSLALLWPVLLWAQWGEGAGGMLTVLAFPAAIGPMRRVVTSRDPRDQIVALSGTGRLLLIYSVIFSIGWCL